MRYTHLIVIGLLLIITLPAMGASSYLGGFSGLILTPSDVIVPDKTWEASFHDTFGLLGGSDADLLSVGVIYGLVPKLEVGVSYVKNDFTASGKYRILEETTTAPSITVGVFDIGGSAASISSDSSFYLLFSKNITDLASDINNRPSKPLRLGLGFGTGFYNGLIANLDWTLEPRLSLLAEYNSGNHGIDELRNRPSVGFRWAASDSLRLDAAVVGFNDIGFGLSYRNTLQ